MNSIVVVMAVINISVTWCHLVDDAFGPPCRVVVADVFAHGKFPVSQKSKH